MDDDKKSLIDKVLFYFSKKELLSWFVIFDLICVIIGLLTWRFSSFQEIVDQVTFAAGVSSILLALLAIVYAFLQSNMSLDQYAFLRANLTKIDQQQNIAILMLRYLNKINKYAKEENKEEIIQATEEAIEVLNNITRTRPRDEKPST